MRNLNLQQCVLGWLLALMCVFAHADGTLTHLSGEVLINRADGSSVTGTSLMEVFAGDVIHTGANGYVRVVMKDDAEIMLRPKSDLKIEQYRFEESKPAEDSFVFKLLRGGLRSITGLISKRGDRDAYRLTTPTATIGVRGTVHDVRVCLDGECGVLADGTYLVVKSGAVGVTNQYGTLTVETGKVVFVPKTGLPVFLKNDPGVGFTPPASFPKTTDKTKSSGPAGPGGTGGSGGSGGTGTGGTGGTGTSTGGTGGTGGTGTTNTAAGQSSSSGVTCYVQ